MARRAPSIGAPSTRSTTVLRDKHGRPILDMDRREYVITLPDGSIEQHTISSSITTVDGSQWNPGMNVPLGVCEDCRHPPFLGLRREAPSHGLVALRWARLCSRCGGRRCPRHLVRRGDQWLCRPCARTSGLWGLVLAFLRFVFLTNRGS